jgi:hypothetical protein
VEAKVGSEGGEEGCWLRLALIIVGDILQGVCSGVGVDVVDQLHTCMRH